MRKPRSETSSLWPTGRRAAWPRPATVLSAIAPLRSKLLRGPRAQGPALTCPQKSREGKEGSYGLSVIHHVPQTSHPCLISSSQNSASPALLAPTEGRKPSPWQVLHTWRRQPSDSGLSDASLFFPAPPPPSSPPQWRYSVRDCPAARGHTESRSLGRSAV